MKTILSLAVVLMVCSSVMGAGVSVYQTDFDALTPGQTQSFPGLDGQDKWFRDLAESPAYGEIADSPERTGQALHQFTGIANPTGQQTIDQQSLISPDLSQYSLITLQADFYCRSSDYALINTYDAALNVGGSPHPGYDIIGFGLNAGNGTPKSQSGVSVGMSFFNGTDNNEPIPLTVGQTLAWETWHTITIEIDQATDRYIAITVDGQTQSLADYMPVRSNDNGTWKRGELMETLSAMITPTDWEDPLQETDDEVYWDNITLTVVPEPITLLVLLAGMPLLTTKRKG